MKDDSSLRELFESEFGFLSGKFAVYELPLPEAETSQEPYIWNPGVYVFLRHGQGVIKVGRSLTNARKRALEHLRDDTAGSMAALKDDPEVTLSLLNVKEPRDKHWVAALEIFFEERLAPDIKSGRLG